MLLSDSEAGRAESDNEQTQSDEAETETSPTRSPTTPISQRGRNSAGELILQLQIQLQSFLIKHIIVYIYHNSLTSHLPLKTRVMSKRQNF